VVYNPEDAEVFLPRLLPVLDTASQSVSDPEVGPGALPLLSESPPTPPCDDREHC
jgi:hypothetical protein